MRAAIAIALPALLGSGCHLLLPLAAGDASADRPPAGELVSGRDAPADQPWISSTDALPGQDRQPTPDWRKPDAQLRDLTSLDVTATSDSCNTALVVTLAAGVQLIVVSTMAAKADFVGCGSNQPDVVMKVVGASPKGVTVSCGLGTSGPVTLFWGTGCPTGSICTTMNCPDSTTFGLGVSSFQLAIARDPLKPLVLLLENQP